MIEGDKSPANATGCSHLRGHLDAVGYFLLPRAASGVGTDAIAEQLGEPIAPWRDGLIQKLTPKAWSTPNTYSGIYGLGRFPFHTDLAHLAVPPRYLLLRCVRGYADVPTLLIDGLNLAEEVGSRTMARALVKPRRPKLGEIRLLRLREIGSEADIIRWDEVYLRPASRIGAEIFERIRSRVNSVAPISVSLVDEGDVLIIDNWRMLHSRPAISEDRRDRVLERVYLGALK